MTFKCGVSGFHVNSSKKSHQKRHLDPLLYIDRFDIDRRLIIPYFGHFLRPLTPSTSSKVDIVINNAGILRDRSILRIAPEDWQSIIDVHMTGAFNVSQV